MSVQFRLPIDSLLSGNAVPLAAGLLYFYASGTTTPLATYSNDGLTIANANPVVLDSEGRHGPIFLQNALDYKVVLKNAAGVQVGSTIDPVHGGPTLNGVSAGYTFARICPAGTIAALPACTYNNGASGVGATLTGNANGVLVIDGYTLTAGDVTTAQPFLIKNQANTTQNGVYVITQTGNAGLPFILTRASYFNSSASAITGIYGVAEESQSIPNTRWLFTNAGITFGTTPITFTQFTAANPLYIGADGNIALAGISWAANSAPQLTGHWEFQSPTNDRAIVVEATTTYGTKQMGIQVDFGSGGTSSDDLLSAFNHSFAGGAGYTFGCFGDNSVRTGGTFCSYANQFAVGASLPGGANCFFSHIGQDGNAKLQLNSATGGGAYNSTISVGGASGFFALNDYNNANTIFKVTNAGATSFPFVGTTASAANAFLDNAASNNLLRSTSRLAYKAELKSLPIADVRRIVRALNPFSYRSKASADDPKRRFFGLGAEHVAEVSDSLVHYGADGKPDGVMYDRVGVLNLVMAQNHDRRLRLMEAAVWLLGIALVASWVVR